MAVTSKQDSFFLEDVIVGKQTMMRQIQGDAKYRENTLHSKVE